MAGGRVWLEKVMLEIFKYTYVVLCFSLRDGKNVFDDSVNMIVLYYVYILIYYFVSTVFTEIFKK